MIDLISSNCVYRMDRWRDKVAVVTGASSGIGAAITQRLLKAGVHVVGLDLKFEHLSEMAKRCAEEGLTLHPIKCDVASEVDLERAFDQVEREFGGVQILVNNAGVTCYKPVVESDRADFERLLNINVIAVASCTAKAVQSMRTNKVEGHIFNINSVLGHEMPAGSISEAAGANGWSLYPASKHASVALTHTVRREVCRDQPFIRITSISPGLVKTDISKHVEALKDLFDKVPALNPSDIADALIYALGTRPEVQITQVTVQRTGEI